MILTVHLKAKGTLFRIENCCLENQKFLYKAIEEDI